MADETNPYSYCPNCGRELNGAANFCPQCGHGLGGNEPAGQTNQAQDVAAEPSFKYKNKRQGSKIIIHKPDATRSVKTVQFKDLHPRAAWVFFISYAGRTSILLLLLIAGSYFDVRFIAGVALYLILHYVAAVIAYRHYQFEINDTSFKKQFGILQVKTVSIPFRRVQNVNVRRSLLDRVLGLAHVDIETAGTGGVLKRGVIGGSTTRSEGHIPGVSPLEAKDIKDLMLKRSHRAGAN